MNSENTKNPRRVYKEATTLKTQLCPTNNPIHSRRKEKEKLIIVKFIRRRMTILRKLLVNQVNINNNKTLSIIAVALLV